MAFVRMILPAWIAGLYAALLIVLLFFFLNPALHLDAPTVARFVPLAFLLSLPAALLWPALYRFIRVFARRRLRVRWYSFKYLFGFAATNLVVVSWIYWFNGSLLRALVPPEMWARLRVASIALSIATSAFIAILCFPRLRRRAAVQIGCYTLAGLLPLGMASIRTGYRPPPESPYTAELARPSSSAPRVLVLGIEGATLDQVLPLVSQGKLPWFGRLLKKGCHGRLSSFRPCVSGVVWQSLLTGKLPYKHQILDSSRYRLPGVARDVRVAPRGFGFRRLARVAGLREVPQDASVSTALTITEIVSRLVSPEEAAQEVRAIPVSDSSGAADRLDRFLDPGVPTPPGTEGLVETLQWALRHDTSSASAGLSAWREGRESVVVAILPGLDRVAHLFLRYAAPESFGNVRQEEIEKFGPVLERYYRFLDEWVGRFLESGTGASGSWSGPGSALVLVVSPHGIEPLPLMGRFLEGLEGNRFESGYHGQAPDGMVIGAGAGARRGGLGKTSILDLVPTLLYRFGLPIGLDMDGHPLTRLFEADFVSTTPVLLIPSYEASRIGGARGSTAENP